MVHEMCVFSHVLLFMIDRCLKSNLNKRETGPV